MERPLAHGGAADVVRDAQLCVAGDGAGAAARAGCGYLGESEAVGTQRGSRPRSVPGGVQRTAAFPTLEERSPQALGVLSYELIVGAEPFAADTSAGPRLVHQRICRCDVRFPAFVSDGAKDFILSVSVAWHQEREADHSSSGSTPPIGCPSSAYRRTCGSWHTRAQLTKFTSCIACCMASSPSASRLV